MSTLAIRKNLTSAVVTTILVVSNAALFATMSSTPAKAQSSYGGVTFLGPAYTFQSLQRPVGQRDVLRRAADDAAQPQWPIRQRHIPWWRKTLHLSGAQRPGRQRDVLELPAGWDGAGSDDPDAPHCAGSGLGPALSRLSDACRRQRHEERPPGRSCTRARHGACRGAVAARVGRAVVSFGQSGALAPHNLAYPSQSLVQSLRDRLWQGQCELWGHGETGALRSGE